MTIMCRRTWIVTVLFLCMVVVATGVHAEDTDQEFEDLFQGALNLVLTNHPTLVSQRSIVASNENLDLARRGMPLSLTVTGDVGTRVIDDELRFIPLVGLSVSLPIIDPNRTIEDEMTRRTALAAVEGDIQDLQTKQEDILNRFTEEVAELIGFHNSMFGQRELLDQLEERRLQMESMVRSGVDPAGLWDLDERISGLRVTLRDLQSQLRMSTNRTAMNYGGEQWVQLKEMLTQLISASEVTVGYE